MEIGPPADPARATELLQEPADLFIFISPNAVNFARRLLGNAGWPKETLLAAVGKGTARALREAGYQVDLQPEAHFDSEGLLALPALSEMSGKRVIIVRGEGGRALLGDQLSARGAQVSYAEVYRRLRPETDPSSLLANWAAQVDLVTATSGEVLANLVAILGRTGWPLLRQSPLLVISERMQQQAKDLGFSTTLLAGNASNEAIVQRLCRWVVGGE
jgi:uroporphyrinogen-III synthase